MIGTLNRWAAAVCVAFLLVTAGRAAGEAGYIDPESFDILAVLPPAPVKGDARYDTDRRIFRETRKLLGTPRGAMAGNDVGRSPEAMLHTYSCALGMELSPAQVPETIAVIERASLDTNAQKERAKEYYRRLRPVQIDRGEACQSRERLAKSFDYPSGHTTGGWTWAQILASLVPERATAILARGRAFGQSRAVCGAHNASAVDAGFLTSSATMTVVRTTPAFQMDMAKAGAEIAAIREAARKPDPARCEAEAKLVRQRVY